jgi:hypothetical protein
MNGGESREDGVKVEAIFKGTASKEFGFAEDHGVQSKKRCEPHIKQLPLSQFQIVFEGVGFLRSYIVAETVSRQLGCRAAAFKSVIL